MVATRLSAASPSAHRPPARSSTTTADPPPPSKIVRPGERWWADDAEELSKDRSRGKGWYTLYLASVAAVGALGVAAIGAPCATTALDVAASAVLPRRALAAVRLSASLLILWTIVQRTRTPILTTKQTLDVAPKRFVTFRQSGLWRLEGLTQWQWAIIGVYFALSGGLTLAVDAAPPSARWLAAPSAAACTARVTLGLAFALALLTNIVVSFVLIPSRIEDGRKGGEGPAAFYRTDELLMHNANVALIVGEVLVDEMHVTSRDVPYALLFGVVYVGWHQYLRFHLTRTLIYFFLNWQLPHALPILLALIAAICAFFGLAYAICEFVRPAVWGAPVIVACTALLVARGVVPRAEG